ncbi:hypothetical protein J7K43_06515 [Candidatus Calescamantes bacterium]|nr:hypothetical protein [Candidatus Calescamantes bacterium]
MKKLKEVVRKWWIFSFIFIFILLPFFYIYLTTTLYHLLFKMQIIEDLGYFPLVNADTLRGLPSFHVFNASLFYVIPLGFLLGTLFWIGWVVKRKKYLYLFFLLSLSFFPLLNTPDAYRNLREGWLIRSKGGRSITNWYYSYTLLPAEGIKGFRDREQRLVYFVGSPPKDFQRWAKEKDIIFKKISLQGKDTLKGADIIFNIPNGVLWEGKEKIEKEISLVSPSLPVKILRFLLSLSLFFFSPLYLTFFIFTFISFPFYYFSKNKIKFYLSIACIFLFLFFFLPMKNITPLPDSLNELRDGVFSSDYYVALTSLEKLSQTSDGEKILREILPLQRRWYIRYAIWKKLKEKGWNGKTSSLEN